MDDARLLGFGLERFKSFPEYEHVHFEPLTIIIGRNNGGKSTLIQSLLLLKQTLAARNDAPLHLDGPLVSALNLRELTWNRPTPGPLTAGPSFTLCWRSTVDFVAALKAAGHPNFNHLIRWTKLPQLKEWLASKTRSFEVHLKIDTREAEEGIVLERIELSMPDLDHGMPLWAIARRGDGWLGRWRPGFRSSNEADQVQIEVDHFLPYLSIDRSAIGPRDRQRAWYNAYLLLLAQPIETLKRILGELKFLGSTRVLPPSLYKPASVAPKDIGVSGELAAQLLHRRGNDVVHYLPALQVVDGTVRVPTEVVERPFIEAVNEVLADLSIRLPVSVHQIQDVGFRLLFGGVSLQHVGRGLTHLLPVVALGLFADPLRFERIGDSLPLDDYRRQCAGQRVHIAFEEPESHLHPKVQSRLAHWLVSLAMAGRSLLVETHSDHLVRRLRGLAARAESGSAIERWLLENVLIIQVEQDAAGESTTTASRLRPDGGMGEHWPADFMDEATMEDDAIAYASLDKDPPVAPEPLVIHDEGPEPEVEG